MADSFFYEADLRKRGFHLKPFKYSSVEAAVPFPYIPPYLCEFDSLTIKNNDILGYFTWGMFYYFRDDFVNAEIKWRHVITLDTANPLVFHYLGKILFTQQRWMEADLLLNFAVKYYTDTTGLKLYAASLKELKSNSPDAECFISTFWQSAYEQTEDHYFLANMYEQWNHFTKAEYHYRKLITMTPGFIGPYKKLWTMLERLGRYRDAEELIINYRFRDQEYGDNELNAFYVRVMENLPGVGYWFLKAGQFLYHFTANARYEFINDKKAIFPDEEKPEEVTPALIYQPRFPFSVTLPGTEERLQHAEDIRYPYSDGIRYLLKADSLLGANEELSADVNDKIGDLYMWQGITVYAAVHYQKSVDMLDVNTGVRNKLIDVYNLLYQFTKAGINLDTLAARNELSYEKLLLRTKYFIHAGSFDSARSNLLLAKATYPYPSPVVADLFARNALLSSKLNEAVIYYTNFLESHPKDSVAMYSMSRVYALQKNKIKSLEWLNRAVKNGFNYGWVLQMDPVMEGLRKTSKFKALVAQTNLKQYPQPTNTYPRKR
jgi:tetratricopeptide (TPR) repeat protein